jgi:hypothetical protein
MYDATYFVVGPSAQTLEFKKDKLNFQHHEIDQKFRYFGKTKWVTSFTP